MQLDVFHELGGTSDPSDAETGRDDLAQGVKSQDSAIDVHREETLEVGLVVRLESKIPIWIV